jgi:excisionase family DNA binding protein
MTTEEVAAYLGVSTRHLDEERRAERIRAIKIGRGYKYREEDVVAYLERKATQLSEPKARSNYRPPAPEAKPWRPTAEEGLALVRETVKMLKASNRKHKP